MTEVLTKYWIILLMPIAAWVGVLIGQLMGAPYPEPAPYAWNRPEVLPPVDCPLVLRLGSVAVRAERVSYLRDRNGEMDYRLSDGSAITGRFEWSYP